MKGYSPSAPTGDIIPPPKDPSAAADAYAPDAPTILLGAADAPDLFKCGSEDSDALAILLEAADAISQRAALRDQPDGERSMVRTVMAFNALTGHTLTESDGWLFMITLKAARSHAGAPHRDDYVDLAGYAALAGECVAHQVQP